MAGKSFLGATGLNSVKQIAESQELVKNMMIVSTDKILENAELEELIHFNKDEKLVDEIAQQMTEFDFNKEEPITVWDDDGVYYVTDGRTRLAAAKKAGLTEVPIYAREFEDIFEAAAYTWERQNYRRHTTGEQIFSVVEKLKEKTAGSDNARYKKMIAALGVSRSTVCKANRLADEGSEEVKEQLRSGEKGINTAYTEMQREKKKLSPKVNIPSHLNDDDYLDNYDDDDDDDDGESETIKNLTSYRRDTAGDDDDAYPPNTKSFSDDDDGEEDDYDVDVDIEQEDETGVNTMLNSAINLIESALKEESREMMKKYVLKAEENIRKALLGIDGY